MQQLHESIRIWRRVLNAEYLINMQQSRLILNINNSKYLIMAFTHHSQAHEIYVSRIFQPEPKLINGELLEKFEDKIFLCFWRKLRQQCPEPGAQFSRHLCTFPQQQSPTEVFSHDCRWYKSCKKFSGKKVVVYQACTGKQQMSLSHRSIPSSYTPRTVSENFILSAGRQ